MEGLRGQAQQLATVMLDDGKANLPGEGGGFLGTALHLLELCGMTKE